MGQKVNPVGLRLGINRTWDSRWYANADFAELLHEDICLRSYLKKRLNQAGVSKIVIERPAKKARMFSAILRALALAAMTKTRNSPAQIKV